MTDSASAWTVLSSRWDELFPLRPPRREMCRRICPPGGRFLDAGCGSGSLVRALREEGVRARGFDLDEAFVRAARNSLLEGDATFARADLREIAAVFPGEVFDAIVSLGQTFPHLLEDEDVSRFLSGARSRMAPPGILVLQVQSDLQAPPVRELPLLEIPGLRLERRRLQLGGNRAALELTLQVPGMERTWRVEHRRWTPDELIDCARRHGWIEDLLSSNEEGAPWTGRESGWILHLRAA